MAKLLEPTGFCYKGPFNFDLLHIRNAVEQLQYTAYIFKSNTIR